MYYLTCSLSFMQPQQPLDNLDAQLRRALSPETVQEGNGVIVGRFQVSFSSSLN